MEHLIWPHVEKLLETLSHPLVLFGFAGQFVFMLRFVVQWWTSERRGRSVVPVAFWYLSLGGGLMLAVYAWMRSDPVFFLGQLLGLAIYVRNLVLIHRRRSLARRRFGVAAQPDPHDESPVEV